MKKPKPKSIKKSKTGRSSESGRFLPGFVQNPKGGPRRGEAKLDRLLDAVARVESKHNINLLDHFVERAFKKDVVLIALMKKLVPDLRSIELQGYVQSGMDEETAKLIREKFKKRFEAIHAQQNS